MIVTRETRQGETLHTNLIESGGLGVLANLIREARLNAPTPLTVTLDNVTYEITERVNAPTSSVVNGSLS